jgi:NADP-dependent 3-hydroxy acid dehydrogenase YdfG
MLQSEDLGEMIRYVATLPARVCVNEIQVSLTRNRGYIAAQQRRL